MPEKELEKLKAIMKKMGYSTADLLVARYGEYRVIHLHSPEENHAKYEGIPYYVLWKDEEVRPATTEERWEIMALN